MCELHTKGLFENHLSLYVFSMLNMLVFFLLSLCLAWMDREAKLRKLEHFRRRVPTTSQSSITEILKEIEKDGLPELKERHHMREARKLILGGDENKYGKLITKVDLPTTDGGSLEAPIVQPLAWLYFLYERCPSIRELIQRSLRAKPCSVEDPWNVILYTDEVTPQNPLSTDLTKKVQALYWSIAEFSPEVLCQENAWFVLSVFRSKLCKQVEGQLARLVGEALKALFVGDSNLLESGMLLLAEGHEPIRIWAKLGVMVQDGAAHKEVWQIKGDAGLRLCMGCNALNFNTDLKDYADGRIPMTCCSADALTWFTDEEIIDKAQRLQQYQTSALLTPEEKKHLGYVTGFTYCRYMLLLDAMLQHIIKPCSQFMHDWMHGLFSSGVFNVLVHVLFEELESEGVKPYENMKTLAGSWKLPRRISQFVSEDMFCERRRKGNREARKFRCQASEGLSVFSIIAYWLAVFCKPNGKAVKACDAFLKFATLATCFQMIQMGAITADRLKDAM